MAHQIDSRLFERQGAKTSIDNFSERLPAPDSDLARESLKDAYVFGFLANRCRRARLAQVRRAIDAAPAMPVPGDRGEEAVAFDN